MALTSLSHGAGCGCKLPASALHPIVAGLPRPTDPRVLVGADLADLAVLAVLAAARLAPPRPAEARFAAGFALARGLAARAARLPPASFHLPGACSTPA